MIYLIFITNNRVVYFKYIYGFLPTFLFKVYMKTTIIIDASKIYGICLANRKILSENLNT